MNTHSIKINLPGGIVSAGDLYEILESAEKANVKNLRFGNRQQLYFYVEETEKNIIERELTTSGIAYEIDEEKFPNLVSSYVCAEIFSSIPWLSEGVFKDVLDLFDFNPTLKINLTDPRQCLIPLLNGNLNFIASEMSNFWYLYVRFPKTNKLFVWPSLVYTDDIASLCSQIEKQIHINKEQFFANQEADGNRLFEKVQKAARGNWQSFQSPLNFTPFALPCYEGFHSYKNRFWLGIYRRNELFPLALMKDICLLAIKTKLGQLYTSSWKSLIIKGIEHSDKQAWEELLRRHQINSGHSVNELNWQLEDLSDEGLELKYYLVRQLEDADLSTTGLSFAIKSRPGSGLFGSVAIRKETAGTYSQDRYTIEHSPNFDAHSKEYISYRASLKKSQLAQALKSLCSEFNTADSRIAVQPSVTQTFTEHTSVNQLRKGHIYQCLHCLTQFDEDLGDPLREITSGTAFLLLEDYTCPLCEAPMEDFELIEKG